MTRGHEDVTTDEGMTDHDYYDPGHDAARRYPDWVIRRRPLLGHLEVLSYKRQTILLERADTPGARRSSLAHAIAHLDLDHRHVRGHKFEALEEAEANDLAARRLINFGHLLDAAIWATCWQELADELDVDIPMLRTRLDGLTWAEQDTLRDACRRTGRDIA